MGTVYDGSSTNGIVVQACDKNEFDMILLMCRREKITTYMITEDDCFWYRKKDRVYICIKEFLEDLR